MSLDIYIDSPGGGRDFGEWFVGKQLRTFIYDHIEHVTHVTASGDELLYVLQRFEELPRLRGNPTTRHTWYGDHAKFILDNLVT